MKEEEEMPNMLTLKRRKMFATIMDSVEKEAPMTPVMGLCGTYLGASPDSHWYSDASYKIK